MVNNIIYCIKSNKNCVKTGLQIESNYKEKCYHNSE